MEPFKNLLSPAVVFQMAARLAAVSSVFNEARFVKVAIEGLEDLELKARSRQIRRALEAALPGSFPEAAGILVAALGPAGEDENLDFGITSEGLAGWAVMPMADYVAEHGLGHFTESMHALREMTMRYTAEFAIRPFLIAEPEKTMSQLRKWARDKNVHVRRLASEGSRPRLPWGLRLQAFDAAPAPLWPLLEALKDDPARYVRRSVANSLNDIAKNHPEAVAKLAKSWLQDASKERASLVRHACRTLLKDGHPATLAVFGYHPPAVLLTDLNLTPLAVKVGETLQMKLQLRSKGPAPQRLILDYAVHFQKAGGKSSRKVFKWRTLNLAATEEVALSKAHSFKVVTTRKYYPGAHAIEILLNGQSLGKADFELV